MDLELSKKCDIPEKVSVMVEYLEHQGLISPSVTEFQIAIGEITMHPKKEIIYKIVRGYTARIDTTAILYDPAIAEALATTKSYCLVSLDSGTRETYAKIKAVDCFDRVVANIEQYLQHGNVALKYIVLNYENGIRNDSDSDFNGIIKIMKKLGRKKLWISRDNKSNSDTNVNRICRSIALLCKLLKNNNLEWKFLPLFVSNEKNYFDVLTQYYQGKAFDERIASLGDKEAL